MCLCARKNMSGMNKTVRSADQYLISKVADIKNSRDYC